MIRVNHSDAGAYREAGTKTKKEDFEKSSFVESEDGTMLEWLRRWTAPHPSPSTPPGRPSELKGAV